MPTTSPHFTQMPDGASCATKPSAAAAEGASGGDVPQASGCCANTNAAEADLHLPMTGRARGTRAAAGGAFLILAGALSSRRLAGGIVLWPASLIPTWFGISHLLAAMIGYQGCPELGAIPSVMLGRPVRTSCSIWRDIDAWIEH
ncbi:MAG TPA: hypothetical protein VID48_15405 [Solirubrobacteraceae bacterium]